MTGAPSFLLFRQIWATVVVGVRNFDLSALFLARIHWLLLRQSFQKPGVHIRFVPSFFPAPRIAFVSFETPDTDQGGPAGSLVLFAIDSFPFPFRAASGVVFACYGFS